MLKTAVGSSMLPSILPKAKLDVCPVQEAASLRVGDVVCYPVDSKTVAAHRIVGIEQQAGATVIVTRGDAQQGVERVPAAAIASKVTRVYYGPFSYDINGIIGGFFAELALKEAVGWRVVRSGAIKACGLALAVKRKIAGKLVERLSRD